MIMVDRGMACWYWCSVNWAGVRSSFFIISILIRVIFLAVILVALLPLIFSACFPIVLKVC
jgi:hypothetical protein